MAGPRSQAARRRLGSPLTGYQKTMPRTGNEVLDILIQVAGIAIIAAILTWILSALGAPGIISTIIWILAVVAIAYVVIQLMQGRGSGGTPGRRAP